MNQRIIAASLLALSRRSQHWAAGEAKNVIFFLGDGMGPATVTAAHLQIRRGRRAEHGATGAHRSYQDFSNDAQTTDSAPSMSAYMTGVKMNNEVISMSSDTKAIAPTLPAGTGNCGSNNGSAVTTMLELAKARARRSVRSPPPASPRNAGCNLCARLPSRCRKRYRGTGGAGRCRFQRGAQGWRGCVDGRRQQVLYPTTAGGVRVDGRNLIDEMKAKGYLTPAPAPS